MIASLAKTAAGPGRGRTTDIDRLAGLKVRQRRIMLGITQQQMADLLGITYQQAHKYETGINRISAGRLHRIASVLGVEVTYFFPGQGEEQSLQPGQPHRQVMELAQNFLALTDPRQRQIVCDLVRSLAGSAATKEDALDEVSTIAA